MTTSDFYTTDTTPSEEVIANYRYALAHHTDNEPNLALIHDRATELEFALGEAYAHSEDPLDRITGAAVLGEIGLGGQAFHDESILILIALLQDTDPRVVAAAASALAHRADARTVPLLAAYADHPAAAVRHGIVSALLPHLNDLCAVRILVRLTQDFDHQVRRLAMNGIEMLIDEESTKIREAVLATPAELGMPEPPPPAPPPEEIVTRSAETLAAEWDTCDEISLLSIAEAEALADPRLLPYLQAFRTELPLEEDARFATILDAAILACGGHPGIGPECAPPEPSEIIMPRLDMAKTTVINFPA